MTRPGAIYLGRINTQHCYEKSFDRYLLVPVGLDHLDSARHVDTCYTSERMSLIHAATCEAC